MRYGELAFDKAKIHVGKPGNPVFQNDDTVCSDGRSKHSLQVGKRGP